MKSPSSPRIEIDWAAYERLSEIERAAFDAQLAQLDDTFKFNPLEGYIPYPKQHQFHTAQERTRAFFGGNRTGKTTCAVVDDLVQALPVELVPEHLRAFKKYGTHSPFKCRVITPDLTDTMEAVLEKFRAMVPQSALKGGAWEDAFDKQKRNLWFARGDRINFMSTEQDPNKFGGQAFHRIHFDEEPAGLNAWKIYRESRMRLIDHSGDMIFSMTPLLETDWVEKQIWEARSGPRVFAVRASMRDNPHLSEEEIEEALADLTEEERKAVEHGEFVAFGGKFFDEFTDELHVRPTPALKEAHDWDIVVGIDPGVQTGIVYVGFDGDNRAFTFAEIYPREKATVPEIAAAIREMNARWDVDPHYVIDPAARIGSGPNQETFEAAYARERIFCEHGMNQRGPGIMELKRRLQSGFAFIAEGCPVLRDQIYRYRRDTAKEDEFAAIKKNDHEVDAWRYAVMARTWHTPKVKVRTSNFNPSPKFEPPWRGPTSTDNPPLGVFS